MAMLKLLVSTLIPSALLLLVASPARANCARPVGYEATVTGNTVQVEPIDFSDRVCPDPSGMLRQSVDTGDIVKLADFCAMGNEFSAYVDECVPAGTYRYGFATPFECQSAACDTSYFVEAIVTDAVASSCAPSPGNAAPTPAASVPWQTDPIICSYHENTGGSGGTGGTGSTTTTTTTTTSQGSGGDIGFPGGGKDFVVEDSGCSVGMGSGAAPVIGANALALIAGLALMRRRRGQAS